MLKQGGESCDNQIQFSSKIGFEDTIDKKSDANSK